MYTFYLGNIIFPIAPASLNIKINNQNRTLTLINEGEINILKNPRLKDISFEVLIPKNKYPFARYLGGTMPVQYYIDTLAAMKDTNKPVQFIVIRTGKGLSSMHFTNLKVSLEDWDELEDADSLGTDLKLSIRLKEYKDKSSLLMQAIGVISGVTQYLTTKTRESTKETLKSYTVAAGDTLYSIAKKQLGNGSLSDTLLSLNNLPNSVDLTVGQVIRLE